ncbi:MAG: hypothetical protein LRZ87_02540, partial [Methanocellales archaeon]|nr:hypothetical protein [Methanocellales archaeon]
MKSRYSLLVAGNDFGDVYLRGLYIITNGRIRIWKGKLSGLLQIPYLYPRCNRKRCMLDEMGYVVTYNPVSIQKDAVGDTGFIDANITSKKSVTVKTKVPGGHTLDFHGTSDMVKYGLFGGIVFFLIDIIFELGWVALVGFMALLVGILLMIKSKEIPKK